MDFHYSRTTSGMEHADTIRFGHEFIPSVRETLENPGQLRDNGFVIAGQDWVDGRQATRLL